MSDGKIIRVVGGVVVRATTEHGLYILIAVIGFVSAIATLFVDLQTQLPVKWFLGLVCLSLVVVLVLIRSLFALASMRDVVRSIRVIKHLPGKRVFLIRSNFDLPVNSLLSVYIEREGYEELFAIGFVENVQDKNVASLRVTREYAQGSQDIDISKKVVVKTTLPYNRLFEES
jgi:hypothetical protein